MNFKLTAITLAGTMLMSISSLAVDKPVPITNAVLSEQEVNNLVWVREEEKLARDTYLTLYDRWGARIFNNISSSEQTHMDAMLGLLNTYGIPDPVTDNTVGVFNDPALTDLYAQLISDGNTSRLDALYVGAFIEELDIKDIREAIDATSQVDIILVYESLLAGSYNHLRAFVGQIENYDIDYKAQVMSQAEVDEILGESSMTALMSDGSWGVTDHNGEGMIIDVTVDGKLVLYWLTYDGNGQQVWLLGLTEESSEATIELTMYQYSGPVFGPAFDENDLASELWGDVKINFLDCGNADVNYQSVSGFGSGDLEIKRIYYAAGSLCQP